MLNQYLRQQLSQDMALVLQQPKGEPEYNMKELQATWEKLMAPNPAATAASGSADTVDAHSEASDIPPGSNLTPLRRASGGRRALCAENYCGIASRGMIAPRYWITVLAVRCPRLAADSASPPVRRTAR